MPDGRKASNPACTSRRSLMDGSLDDQSDSDGTEASAAEAAPAAKGLIGDGGREGAMVRLRADNERFRGKVKEDIMAEEIAEVKRVGRRDNLSLSFASVDSRLVALAHRFPFRWTVCGWPSTPRSSAS